MLYLLLIQFNPAQEGKPEDAKLGKHAHEALERELRSEGKFVLFGGLMPPEYGGTRLRVQGGVVSDGPFAETKELLAGFYVVEAANQAEAQTIANRVPVDSRGWVEVRQIPYFRTDAERAAKCESAAM